MKNILLFVHDDVGQEARFQAAVDVTRALDGHLTCVDVIQLPVMAVDAYGSTALAVCLDIERETEGRNRKTLETRLAGEGISWSWRDFTGSFVEGIMESAGLADLIVLNRNIEASRLSDTHGLTGNVIVESRKPVLAVADAANGFRAAGRALIAWDGSSAVTNTVQSCIPLLKLASSVRLFSAETYKSDTDLNDAATYLSRHGIHADIQRVYDEQRPVAATIQDECVRWDADWCLMGGYGHSRLREALVGGVTRQMLSESKVPLVIGH
jgi:nucleotide-binding universal stress UspA family protein